MKSINNLPYLEETLRQFERKTHVFYQRTPVEPCYINSLNLISCLRYLFHFHFSFCAHEQDVYGRVQPLQRIGNCNCRKNMSARSASCYDDFVVQFLNVQCSMLNVQLLTLQLLYVPGNTQDDADS